MVYKKLNVETYISRRFTTAGHLEGGAYEQNPVYGGGVFSKFSEKLIEESAFNGDVFNQSCHGRLDEFVLFGFGRA